MKKITLIILVLVLAITTVFANADAEEKQIRKDERTDAKVSDVKALVKDFENRLEIEKTARIDSDELLEGFLGSLEQVMGTYFNDIDFTFGNFNSDSNSKIDANAQAIANEKTDRIKAVSSLQLAIEAVEQELKSYVDSLASKAEAKLEATVAEVKTDRIKAVSSLQLAIEAVEQELKSYADSLASKAEAKLETTVAEVKTDYKKADAQLKSYVDSFASKAEATLEATVQDVTTDYQKADSELKNSMDKMNSDLKKDIQDVKASINGTGMNSASRIDSLEKVLMIAAGVVVLGYIILSIRIRSLKKKINKSK